jgi:hypothetical protein
MGCCNPCPPRHCPAIRPSGSRYTGSVRAEIRLAITSDERHRVGTNRGWPRLPAPPVVVPAPLGAPPTQVGRWFDRTITVVLPAYTQRADRVGVAAWCALVRPPRAAPPAGHGHQRRCFLTAESRRGLKVAIIGLRRAAIRYLHYATSPGRAGCASSCRSPRARPRQPVPGERQPRHRASLHRTHSRMMPPHYSNAPGRAPARRPRPGPALGAVRAPRRDHLSGVS